MRLCFTINMLSMIGKNTTVLVYICTSFFSSFVLLRSILVHKVRAFTKEQYTIKICKTINFFM